MDYTLNIVSKCRFFSLYLNIRWLQKGPGKFFMGSWKVLDFLSVKECEVWTLHSTATYSSLSLYVHILIYRPF